MKYIGEALIDASWELVNSAAMGRIKDTPEVRQEIKKTLEFLPVINECFEDTSGSISEAIRSDAIMYGSAERASQIIQTANPEALYKNIERFGVALHELGNILIYKLI